jgi:GNAT superfamily N-acetyltransferase
MSSEVKHLVDLSEPDEERFGIRIARTEIAGLEVLPAVYDFCKAHNVVMLIARCASKDIRIAQTLERDNFSLMDTLVYYAFNLKRGQISPDTGKVLVRFFKVGDEQFIENVAQRSFQGYFGHYHADSRLDQAKSDEVYVSWALRLCAYRDASNDVIVADADGSIVGFATLRLNRPEEGEGVLFGVAPEAQGKGIYRSFMIHGMQWCLAKGAERMVVSTQVTNIAVQKVWTRLGFEPSHAYYIFHKWFD